jgi:hypothetical protein
MLKIGQNKITGSALIRLASGSVISCAGLPVYLVPATGYATERMQHLFKSTTSGYSSINMIAHIPKLTPSFSPDYTDFHLLRKKSICDAQGYFEFENIADGQFYVLTTITWHVASSQYESYVYGGSLMERVSAFDGQKVRVVLSSN